MKLQDQGLLDFRMHPLQGCKDLGVNLPQELLGASLFSQNVNDGARSHWDKNSLTEMKASIFKTQFIVTASISDTHHYSPKWETLEPHPFLESYLVELGKGEGEGYDS